MRNSLVPVSLGLALWVGPAAAHAFPKSAVPAVGSIVTAPAAVVIDFTEGVEPRFSSIAVTNAQGARVDHGAPRLEGDDRHLAVALDPLPAGTYRVVWHATAIDTHQTQGSFTFSCR